MPAMPKPFDPVVDIPSLKDKVILITGANTGLGKKSALKLAKHEPAELWITARDTMKGNAAVEEVQNQSPGVKIRFLELDLASFDSIKTAVKTFLTSASRLDLLFLNAGILGHPATLTKDGYEIHMGTNHLGHALLLKLLTPLLIESASNSADICVVSLTSIGYRLSDSTIHFDKLKEPSGFPQIVRYVQSKLANLLYAQQVATNSPQFTTVSVHPGEVDTELIQREPGDDQVKYLVTEIAPKRVKTLEEGVMNQLWAATAKDVESGAYYERIGVRAEEGLANDEDMAKKLWGWTQKELEGHDI